MPEKHMSVLFDYLKRWLSTTTHPLSTATRTLVSESWLNPCLVVSVFTVAIYFIFLTGCRPQEAAYIVHHKNVRKNPYYDFADRAAFIAETPADFNKTDRDYVWLVPQY